ncbi:uncharacterized protein LOC101237868 isoform X1 [Hydra vulgaris]|uniref:uncharacterized protein LOC101237868 isoform X1 n=2 Tax=Hydra vulgaris TaxID=6087 RepID=UPI001F5F49F1|nr:uncharacterized protein LOC101237868 isoform X1 [Hydra vulgaris]XP_047141549.1 uncharacterized protein LOC101237868 isoform X2 [Hydra vulgaris]XP_047141550.1 uncharacterized protein LOC101237868 isoform X3 [Hydra vulgaris]XP_047141551.1 uncharacterized protein LOC101237868 isoform X4 [Hydra vulgaris]
MKEKIIALISCENNENQRKLISEVTIYVDVFKDEKNIDKDDNNLLRKHTCKSSLSDLIGFDSVLNEKFFSWMFSRRYGWAENYDTQEDKKSPESSKSTSYQQDLNIEIDKLLGWIEYHQHLSYYLLCGYKHVLVSNSTSPIVRKHLMLSLFRWLKNLSIKYVLVTEKCFVLLRDIIVIGLTDVWSVIRKDTSSRLAILLQIITLEQLKNLFTTLTEVCRNEKTKWQNEPNWQASDGAIKGIEKILSSCEWEAASNTKTVDSSSSVLIKIGRMYFDSLPSFMRDGLEGILFTLFSNSQLSIRETAGKALSILLNKSDLNHFVESFERVVNHLAFYVKEIETQANFMNPYEAEGFMNVLLFLIKSVPLLHLLSKWHYYWSIFSHYLSHPASTVRQAASSLFKYLVSKEQSSPCLPKIILQSLCSGWKSNTDLLVQPIHNLEKDRISILHANKMSELQLTWEWREGRLFAYELVLMSLITNHKYFNLSSKTSSPRLSSSVNETLVKKLSPPVSRANGHNKLSKSLTVSGLWHTKQKFNNPERPEIPSQLTKILKEPHSDVVLLEENIKVVNFTELPDGVSSKAYLMDQVSLNWLEKQECVSFRVIIKQILLQCVECLVDSRWELRRMALQLIPVIIKVFQQVYKSFLIELFNVSIVNSPLYYGSCLCLFHLLNISIKDKKNSFESGLTKFLDGYEDCDSLMDMCEKVAENLSLCFHKETSDISISLLVLFSSCSDEPISGVIHQAISNHFYKCYRNISSESLSEDEKFEEKKKLVDTLCSCQSYLVDYCSCGDTNYTILLLPVFFMALLHVKNDALDVSAILISCEKILKNIDSNTCETNTDLLQSCEIIGLLFDRYIHEAPYLVYLFKVTYSLQLVMKQHFPLKNLKDVLQSKLLLIDSGTLLSSPYKTRNRNGITDNILPVNYNLKSTQLSDSVEFSGESDGDDWDWSSDEEKGNDSSKDALSEFLKKLTETQGTFT